MKGGEIILHTIILLNLLSYITKLKLRIIVKVWCCKLKLYLLLKVSLYQIEYLCTLTVFYNRLKIVTSCTAALKYVFFILGGNRKNHHSETREKTRVNYMWRVHIVHLQIK